MTIMQTNLFAPIYLTRAVTRQWLDIPVALSDSADVARGKRDETFDLKKKIIFISSISGQIVNRPQCQMAYNASKAGLTMVGKVRFPFRSPHTTFLTPNVSHTRTALGSVTFMRGPPRYES
jgi:hypothetical protein